jgi:hypothetical protein
MPLVFTIHASRRLLQRGIPKTWVEATITAPDWTVPDPVNPQLTRAFKRLPEAGGRVLRVVYLKEEDDFVIITAFPDRNAG